MNQPRPPQGQPPFPDVRSALLLTVGASLAGGLIGVFFIDLGMLAAQGLGTAIGIGGVATLAARRIAEPQAARIGMTGVEWRAWPMILCLMPAVLVASELDNFAFDWSPAPKAEASGSTDADPSGGADASSENSGGETSVIPAGASAVEPTDEKDVANPTEEPNSKTPAPEVPEPIPPLIDPNSPFSLMEGLIVFVGITPVVHEFLFRGVLQQGLVTQLGLSRGLMVTALLSTILRLPYSPTVARFVAAYLISFGMSWLLGLVRAATGSILGSIVLASLWAAVGFTALALEERMALPGVNVEGTHLPVAVTIASVLLVAWAAQQVHAAAHARVHGDT